ncbi:hypothetical protein IVA80_15500 [Bradyrhizobium sp. 139]|uniref:hypothetical protein n=1 Tax=Bradyrhizobium sp. 139 TaxID=2782616 RepID=UPI001FF99B72|nr:hypothetical protein [Bradyrhizobium sp. 139]MCK1742230.1 hypothetical protein [Bradyrhizobium sp. 139]
MTAPADLIEEMTDLTGLLAIVLAGPDADTAIDGIYRVVLEIQARLDLLKETLKCT